MKKLDSSLKNMVLVLVCVAFISGGLLAEVNHITEKPIANQQEKVLADGIKAVMGTEKVTVTGNDTVYKNIDNGKQTFILHLIGTQGTAVESIVNGFGGPLRVLVGFSPEGEILGYTILQTSETPGLGVKAEMWFQKDGKGNIIGRQAGSLKVTKDGGDVDAITASTITSRAFLKAVNQAYQAIKK
ncbi:MAG: RnfABCDGE type electron transport complex subunit G [Prevotella sp.]|jgi:electron transport complex protein RnfG|nr:RnfABCDGE type electron transport complex subunit G [Prevotella sp.]MCI1281772.1 RnfABCDGE type electron transport complex subunit G [Prevotella sp.]